MRKFELIAVTFLCFMALSCESREEKARRLHAWCEVHLDELTWPVVDLRELTGMSEPIDACQMWLVDPLREGLPEFERIVGDRWGFVCEEEYFGTLPEDEPPDMEACNLLVWVDPVLLGNYRDGILHCRPADDVECGGSPAGSRTRCDVADQTVRLGELSGGEGVIGGSVCPFIPSNPPPS